jgi:hypothetical protein
MVVHDESRFMEAHLRYHQAAGVERSYVFLDGTTDASGRIAASFPFVRVCEIPSAARRDFPSLREMQSWCADQALGEALREGIDWLLHIDPDEFAHGEGAQGGAWERAGLRQLAARQGPRVEQVVLRPLEAVPDAAIAEHAFLEQVFFQDPARPWSRSLPTAPGKEPRSFDGMLGHFTGKAMVRTRAAAVRCRGPHRFERRRGPLRWLRGDLRTVEDGVVFHYVIVGARHWLEKYQVQADFRGPGRGSIPDKFPKQAWKEASLAMDEAAARRFLEGSVLLSREALEKAAAEGLLRRDERILELCRALALPPPPASD